MQSFSTKHIQRRWGAMLCAACLLCGLFAACAGGNGGNVSPAAENERHTATTFAMSTVVTQTAYGPNAEAAMQQVNLALAAFEDRLSLFADGSEIAAINSAAGQPGGAEVSAETADFLQRALALSGQSENAFALTIAPLTMAWGITTNEPRVVPSQEIDALLPLVDDSAVAVEGHWVILPREGMGLDLGGIAKGESCSLAKAIYEEKGVDSALFWVGGNTYARGLKPDGTPWRIGFRSPEQGGDAYIASFDLTDSTIAVSDGSERFFEQDGVTYIHIIDPATGAPAVSDVLSVGVICEDGAEADFWSTTLFVWGMERALEEMRGGATAILLDYDHNLYISESLRPSFALYEGLEGDYTLTFVPEG